MRKLGIEEWLAKIVQSIYRNARSPIRFNRAFSDDFLVQVRLHQGSVLHPLLFVIVLDVLSREVRSGCPEVLVHADDFALVSETLEDLKGRLGAWKRALESKWLRVNVKKTKMISSENSGKVTIEGKFPCAVFRKGVGSLQCCGHKKCSGIRGELKEDNKFKSQTCAN